MRFSIPALIAVISEASIFQGSLMPKLCLKSDDLMTFGSVDDIFKLPEGFEYTGDTDSVRQMFLWDAAFARPF